MPRQPFSSSAAHAVSALPSSLFVLRRVLRHVRCRHASSLLPRPDSRPLVTAAPRREHFDVPCRSNGSITIDVFRASSPTSPVIVYLPPGPVLPDCLEEQNQAIQILRQRGCATIARINYRASSLHPYPTPCHDVLAGWDWLRANLLRQDLNQPHLAKLGVCGELVGGSLATMLALTECRLGDNRIVAAAVNNPIADWVFPDHLPPVSPAELPEPNAPDETLLPADEDLTHSQSVHEKEEERPIRKHKKRTPKTQPLTAWQAHAHHELLPTVTLCAERDMLFRRPDDYFDRFASPIHFFRSPSAQLMYPQSDDVSASLQPDLELDMESQMHLNHLSALENSAAVAPPVPTLTRCRSYARHFPPAGTSLSLPSWNITTGEQSPLFNQATDLARMIKRSMARHKLKSQSGRTKWFDAEEKMRFDEEAQLRIQFHTGQGLGLWTQQYDNPDWKADVERVADWMKGNLASGGSR